MSTTVTRLREKYKKEIVKQLTEELKIKNPMAVPNLEKIVLNVGAGKTKDDNTLLDELVANITNISGQKPIVTRAKIAISNFKVREGLQVGIKVTLRGDRMWFFLDKLLNIALPRTKDFRGVPAKAFDGKGNYSLGIRDYTIFPEIDTTKSIRLHGMQVSIITTATNDEDSKVLLKLLGMPFAHK